MKLFRVFGNPIAHSRSPDIHRAFARQFGISIEYGRQLVELDQFPQAVQRFFAAGGSGINVTVPFKEQAFALCDVLSDEASAAQAVNTLSWKDGKVFGDNTDGVGLVNDLLQHGIKLKQRKLLLLGAGGAARGVILPLLQQQPELLVIANRSEQKALALAQQFQHPAIVAGRFSDIPKQCFDLVINATSASLSGFVPDIEPNCIGESTWCYDMVYGKQPTAFMLWAQQQGCQQGLDGLGMLVHQAAKSFEIWLGVQPDTQPVLQQLRQELEAE